MNKLGEITNTNTEYSEVKKALNASAPERVVCRNKENAELEGLLVSAFEGNHPLSLYVNGQPGTGKTLSVNHTLEKLRNKYKFKKMILNCMTINNLLGMYKLVIQEISTGKLDSSSSVLTPSKRNSKESLGKTVEALITSLKHHFVLVLDEIDQIENCMKNPADFYKIFNWPFLPNSKLVLIGIANSLDFTDRILPRLELKPEFKPKTIKFLPYSKEDIIQIVKDRLGSINTTVIDDKALTLCASKIASTSGDIRRVLDICRRAIEYIEQESKVNPAIKSVGIGQMMRIFNEVNPITNSNLDKSTMPLLQKILLCTILLCNKDMKIKEIPYSKLLEKFNKVCKSYSTEIGSDSEFMNICSSLQDNGLIDVKKSKEIRNSKFTLRLDEQELRDRLQDETLMSDILSTKFY